MPKDKTRELQEERTQVRNEGDLPSDFHPLQVELRERLIRETRQRVKTILSSKEPIEADVFLNLGAEFLRAAEHANEPRLQAFIEGGFPVNWQEPETGQTALHLVAAFQARSALKLLLRTNALNFLLRDHEGRLASEMAYLYGNDVAMARLLGNKERKQAEAQGITLTRRP
jgi:ankyrin repeat protein